MGSDAKNQGKPPEHAPAHGARDRDEIEHDPDDSYSFESIDNYRTKEDAEKLIQRLPSLPSTDLERITGQVATKNPIRRTIADAAADELDRRAGEFKQQAIRIRYGSKTDFDAKIPLRPIGKQWGSFAGTVLLVAVLAWFGRASIEVNAHAEARADAILIAPDFAEGMKASGSYWALTDEERAEVDRAIKHGEGR